jgi:hypothetical protein
MPNSKLTALTLLSEAQISADNLQYQVDDPAGVPASRKATNGMLFTNYYKVTATVASNNLTVAIKHLDGTNPTAANPLVFKIGDAFKLAVSALSTTKNAGTNWCNAGGAELLANPVDFFVYVLNETGASAGLKILFSRIPHAITMADFVNTSTNDKYPAGNWTNFNATDAVTNVGRFRAQNSGTASFNWSIAAANVVSFPILTTDWLYWTPVHVGFTATVPTGGGYRYRLSANLLSIAYNPLTPGVSNANTYTLTVPFLAKNIANYYQYSATGWTHDNSGEVANGVCWIPPNSRVVNVRKSALAVWTTSNNKIVAFNMIIEIE